MHQGKAAARLCQHVIKYLLYICNTHSILWLGVMDSLLVGVRLLSLTWVTASAAKAAAAVEIDNSKMIRTNHRKTRHSAPCQLTPATCLPVYCLCSRGSPLCKKALSPSSVSVYGQIRRWAAHECLDLHLNGEVKGTCCCLVSGNRNEAL